MTAADALLRASPAPRPKANIAVGLRTSTATRASARCCAAARHGQPFRRRRVAAAPPSTKLPAGAQWQRSRTNRAHGPRSQAWRIAFLRRKMRLCDVVQLPFLLDAFAGVAENNLFGLEAVGDPRDDQERYPEYVVPDSVSTTETKMGGVKDGRSYE